MPRAIRQLFFLFSPQILIVSFLFYLYSSCALSWKVLSPDIEYQDLASNPLGTHTHIHAFRIDLNTNQLESILAKRLPQPKRHATIQEFAQQTDALIAINGGFFDDVYRPLGLRISRYSELNPIKKISWWGIFYIEAQMPHIIPESKFKYNEQISFAVQSGPRLIVKGKIPSLRPGLAERSALGITKDNKLIILVTENNPLQLVSLAELMKDSLQCKQALNLDGGRSSQLFARINDFHLNVSGLSNVSDALIIQEKKIKKTEAEYTTAVG